MSARLWSIGLGAPRARVGFADAMALAGRICPPTVNPASLESVYRRVGIHARGCAILDQEGQQTLYAQGQPQPGPTTAQRLARFRAAAAGLAHHAATDALRRAGVAAESVTHLITASCTGFDAPGFDQSLMRSLALRPTVRRAHLGFMGCHAAINALALADSIARADPGAITLVCCAEICSLHYHYTDRLDRLIANALFADGAAAAIVRAAEPGSVAPKIAGFASAVFADTADDMAWSIGDHGFEMTLAQSVPDTLRRVVADWVGAALDAHGLSRRDVGAWAIHPGGPRIVRAIADALSLTDAQIAPSLEVLRAHGNMSSPTALFILRSLWEAEAPRPWVCLAFGPGLAAEAIILR